MRKRALVAISLFAFAGCAGASHDDSSRSPVTQKDIAYSAAPGATPFGVMSDASPAPAAASASVAVSSPAAAVAEPSTPADAAPAPSAAALPVASPAALILSVHTSPAVVHDGDTLLWNVRTASDVVDVVAHVTVYAFRLQKQSTGQYILTFTVPHGVPGFFHGTYTLDLVARTASGAQSSMKVPVSFQ